MGRKEVQRVFLELVQMDAASGKEKEVAEYLKKLYAELGVNLEEDECGNLFGRIPGEGKPVLFSSHMDTVTPSAGKKILVEEDGTVHSDGTTILGADDVSGLVEIYELVKWATATKKKHRPIEVLFTVGEELYCEGAKKFDFEKVEAKEAYVLDLNGEIGKAAYGAPTILSFQATVKGRAAHAGFNPEDGIHSIAIAARVIARLPLGHVKTGVVGNVGLIQGGTGTNIVPAETVIRGEIRSLTHKEAIALAEKYHRIFEEEARLQQADLEWNQRIHIQAYETSLDSSVIKNYKNALDKLGIKADLDKTFGGSDQNVFAQHGLEGIVIANSMNNAHTVQEYANFYEMEQVIQILKELVQSNS